MVIKYSFFSLLLLLCFSACTKISETKIGTGLIPPVDGVITKDTNLFVYAKNTSNNDTVKPALIDDHILGYTNDPLFGTTTGVINVQMQPDSYPFTFGTGSDFRFDSVVLALDVRGVWGDTLQPLRVHVKEIDNNQSFQYDSSSIRYNNTSQFRATNELIYGGMAMVDPRTLNDSFKFAKYSDSGINAMRIRLADEFGKRLLSTYDTTNEYKSDSLFRIAFKGFQISTDSAGSGSNALVRVGLGDNNSGSFVTDANTRLAIYYNYLNSSGTRDTAVKYFYVSGTSAHSNRIVRNLTGTPAAAYYPSTSTAANDEFLYLQSSPGTITTLTLDSGVTKLPNWIIHRAEIVMEEALPNNISMFDTMYAPYTFMVVKESNTLPFVADTDKFVIPGFYTNEPSTSDAVFSNQVLANYGEFGGVPLRKYNAAGVRINYYNFNLSRYIQGIVTNKNPLYPLTLFTPYRQLYRFSKGNATTVSVSSSPLNTAGIGRVRLYGGGTDTTNTHRIKLHIVYSLPH